MNAEKSLEMAKEVTQLCKEALKYARKLRGENPTPRQLTEIGYNIQEEYGDIKNCIEVYPQSTQTYLTKCRLTVL